MPKRIRERNAKPKSMTTCAKLLNRAETIKRCLDRRIAGEKNAIIARSEGVSVSEISKWAAEIGLPKAVLGRPRGHNLAVQHNIVTAKFMKAGGQKIREIARQLNVTRERVRQYLLE